MLEGLNQAMEHIEAHLDQPLDVADLARIAMTSEYHLRRLRSRRWRGCRCRSTSGAGG